MMGYWKIIGAKPLQLVDETFYSFSTDDVNCKYHDRRNLLASIALREPVKRRSDKGMLTTSPMIKLAKDGEGEAESFSTV